MSAFHAPVFPVQCGRATSLLRIWGMADEESHPFLESLVDSGSWRAPEFQLRYYYAIKLKLGNRQL